MTPYRPIFLSLTVVMISLLIYRNGLSKSTVCSMLLTASLSATPEIVKFINRDLLLTTVTNQNEVEVFEISIEGMRCEACANRIKTALAIQNGVIQSKVDFSEQKAIVLAELGFNELGRKLVEIIQKLDDSYKVKLLTKYTESKKSQISQNREQPLENSVKLEVFEFEVKGMHCHGCATGLQATLAKVEDVIKAEVSFKESKATVKSKPSSVTADSLEKVIRDVDESYVVNLLKTYIE